MGAAGVGRLCRKGSDALHGWTLPEFALPANPNFELAQAPQPAQSTQKAPENFVLAVNLVPQ